MSAGTRPVLLDSWAARSCPVKTQNAFDPAIHLPSGRPATDDAHAAESEAELFTGSQAFADDVCTRLASAIGAVDLRATGDSERSAATVGAIGDGAPVVIAPVLPASERGHRTGSPDALVQAGRTPDGRPGYLPVIITPHAVLERHHTHAEFTWLSALDDPSPLAATLSSEQTFRSGRQGPLLQAAHFWRLLEDLDLIPDPDSPGLAGRRLTGLIGGDRPRTDDAPLAADGLVVSWLDLDHRFIRTFSRTAASGWRRRSVLDRYDHEHAFRVAVASHAADSSAGPGHEPMVSPIVVRECESCQWWSVCEPRLDADDLSVRISKAPLDIREIATLRRMGISTVDDLAAADLEALLPEYLPQVQHRPEPERRIRLAARRARLIRDGVALERNDDDPIDLPSSRLEIDLDIETSPDDRVYLWGLWVDDPDAVLASSAGRPGPYYLAFSSFDELDDVTEATLAAEAVEWLDDAVRACPDCLIVHYSDYELVHLRRFARNFARPGSPVHSGDIAARAGHLLGSGQFLDLFTVMRRHFFGTAGLGLKAVAQAGPGFSWRDPEPGGLNSQTWWSRAVGDPDPAIRRDSAERVLRYNEDDVRATHELRAWLRGLPSS
ncbi:TM0106 family RecB-like putative nuclease [Acidipropionibacterium acidipropionici]|uniref:Nuclease n=2 Tax=Acidipropionibacterium acidipropionici TaxID=1748 RepID=A0A142KGA4_9ACTN|nr:TM0106 family RecB-like putative nuclease [Acidipropionibacterium acidipropionici]AFV90422.1 Nuclease, RecB family [Acidipropionibacterium acidipropionici ATCC 4875]ALN15351.1 nuclease [Acidipropionibacterium acidipropionici]AMS05142.1 nuclease [Acidipropionibacterium acidipropionici]AOZ46625.1 nuclease [Acidipropionibacterium acidipropionici]APZ08904.1 nuclease [Acidipropionibacterium acidipropionici]